MCKSVGLQKAERESSIWTMELLITVRRGLMSSEDLLTLMKALEEGPFDSALVGAAGAVIEGGLMWKEEDSEFGIFSGRLEKFGRVFGLAGKGRPVVRQEKE